MSETVEPNKQPEFDPEVQAFFQICSKKLDEHNDRHERLVKLSRDITIESKRIIFLLHRVQDDETKLKLTAEADSKLKWVQKNINMHILYCLMAWQCTDCFYSIDYK